MTPKRFFLAALVLILVSTAAAQSRFTLEQVMSAPFPSELAVARNAPRIGWVFNLSGVRNVWVADAPAFAARQVTHYAADDGMPLASLRLTPDGKTAVFARGSETNGRGEVADPTSGVQQRHQEVWAVDIDQPTQPRLLGTMDCGSEGCEDIKLSPDGQFALWAARGKLWIAPVSGAEKAKSLTYARGTSEDPQWSPDGKKIAFTSGRGDHSFVAIYEFGRDTLRFMAPSVDRDGYARWSPDGTQIAFIRQPGQQQKLAILPVRPRPWAVWVGNPSTGEARQIWHSTFDANGSFPRMVADQSFHFAGNRITFASEQDGWAHLYSVPATGGKETLLTPGQFDIEHVSLSADRKSLVFSSNQDDIDRRHLWRVSVESGPPQDLTKGESIEWAPQETGDGKYVVFFGSTAIMPGLPQVIGPQPGSPARAAVARDGVANGRQTIAKEVLPADFPASQLVTPKQAIFKSEDGLEIHGQLFVPNGRTRPGPALVFIHGGSMRQMMLGWHNMNYYANAYAENQYLASLGYVVLSVNYRTGIQYGRAFRESPNTGMRGGYEYRDIVAAGRYLQSLPIVDKSKIGLWGGSYGGYLTAMGLAHNSDIFAAGVDLHGVHDWWNESRAARLGASGAPDLAEAQKLAWESSPDSAIATWRSPVLLIQGDDDRNVAFTQTVDLVQRLRAQKVPFEVMVFPDEIHDFLMWKSWVRAYQAGADFFNRVLVKGEKIGVPQ
jgi:dipeptidyl aminopeptidase/acylaminoacyl peptidase